MTGEEERAGENMGKICSGFVMMMMMCLLSGTESFVSGPKESCYLESSNLDDMTGG